MVHMFVHLSHLKYKEGFMVAKMEPLNVLAAISFDLKFIYVLVRWEGNAHDSRVLNYAFARPRGFSILESIIGLLHLLSFSVNKFCLFY